MKRQNIEKHLNKCRASISGALFGKAFVLGVFSLLFVLCLSVSFVSAFDTYISNPVSYFNGSIGIGTSSPSQALDVVGTVKATTFSGAGTSLTGTASSLTCGAGDSATSFFSTGTIEDARLSFTLQDAVSDGGCASCITDAMVSNTLTASDVSCTNCLTSTEVASADSATTASGLVCTDCVDGSDLADSITLDANLNIDSNTFVIDYTNDRVGIGTSSPTSKLEVAGNAQFGDYAVGFKTGSGYTLTLFAHYVGSTSNSCDTICENEAVARSFRTGSGRCLMAYDYGSIATPFACSSTISTSRECLCTATVLNSGFN